ncbi:MAG: hypothetical protein ACE5KE_03460 [Methanosarcinales archaeon]
MYSKFENRLSIWLFENPILNPIIKSMLYIVRTMPNSANPKRILKEVFSKVKSFMIFGSGIDLTNFSASSTGIKKIHTIRIIDVTTNFSNIITSKILIKLSNIKLIKGIWILIPNLDIYIVKVTESPIQ